MNQLILGDCLEVMRKMDSESIDLIYLDPPFFSNRNYEVIWGDKGEVRSLSVNEISKLIHQKIDIIKKDWLNGLIENILILQSSNGEEIYSVNISLINQK